MAEIPMVCRHTTLRFHSGGHYIQCDECRGWWTASRDAHTPKETTDFDRSAHSAVIGGEARVLSSSTKEPKP